MELLRLKERVKAKVKRTGPIPLFVRTLAENGVTIDRVAVDVVQVNLGRLCNQACTHCYVDASPTRRKQNMGENTVARLLEVARNSRGLKAVDITGGAPEMNPHFRRLVEGIRKLGLEVINRTGLTILLEPGQGGTIDFLKQQKVHVMASFPTLEAGSFDKQRGKGAFLKSIAALQSLNQAGYGTDDETLRLDLISNPTGVDLPELQDQQETLFKKQLQDLYGIRFHRLFSLTNMPIRRYAKELERKGRFGEYMSLLVRSFNKQAAEKVMCRRQVSVSWEGRLHDCEFNQMMEIPLSYKRRTIWDIDSFDEVIDFPIALANHCYGCTAGAGSSFGGSLV